MGNGAQQTQLQCSICDSTVVQLAALEGGELDGCYAYVELNSPNVSPKPQVPLSVEEVSQGKEKILLPMQ